MTSGFQFIVMTPPGLPDPSLAIAASRAGAIGVLDLEYTRDRRAALEALTRLERYARSDFGVKLGGNADDLLATLLAEPPEHLRTVILTGADERLAARVSDFHERGLSVIVEARSLEDAQAAERAGCDAVIAKGHEAGGRVGEEGAFVLLQRLLRGVKLPVWVQGGIGLHTIAACRAAGAAGVVLDSQVLLTRESPLSDAVKTRIADMDGSETACLGGDLGEMYRAYFRPGVSAVAELRDLETQLAADQDVSQWREAVAQRAGWDSVEEDLLPLGQDAAFAARLSERFQTVGGIIDAMRHSIDDSLRTARELCPLDEGAPLAASHGTRYPIVQGPMTRVSDRAEFARSVAENGGLPFLALALMRGPEVRQLLEETRDKLGDLPWGVGILGFVPQDLRQEQLAEVNACRPPFALIAGGRPDQARAMGKEGTATYLHVPSPGLLKLFLQDGARRFVFEGRECGGHVGPRSSFVLWETMVEVLIDWLDSNNGAASDCHVLFAGGIHDALSSSMVAAIAAPLAERGVKVGALMGTAYLYTEEAVASGAITATYQQESIRCTKTVLLETGPGHSTRVAMTPYAQIFLEKKQELVAAGLSAEEVRNTLEDLNIGRLRMATKGIDRNPQHGQEPGAPEFVTLDEEVQRQRGTYMIGQVAALRDRVCAVAELHEDVSVAGSERLRSLPIDAAEHILEPEEEPSAIAIVGMGCILPGASSLQKFWDNVLNKVDAIREVPADRWDWREYYDPDPKAKDKVYSKWGGFLDDVPFDPLYWGIPPNALTSIEPMQLLALEVVRSALEDAGYGQRPFNRERTSVMFGAGGGAGDVGVGYVARSMLPTMFGEAADEIADKLGDTLPEWTEDSFAGLLMNVAAGRVANRFDFGGTNCTVDAACASSLAAIHLAVKELETRTCDVAIAGGVDAIQNPFAFLCFSKTEALSPSGRCRPYDASADGIAISEGFAALVLKRLEDAERDGDRVYAVIRGVGSSSDGRSKGLTAPRPEGQVRALQRAYSKARVTPSHVGLIEGHGTGTVAGDQAEVLALASFFDDAQAASRSCALGSVKSMIGHTKCTAGVAGLIKVALALHHKVLPPTIGVSKPNPHARFGEGPLYVNTETRPWLNGADGHPRSAGVSAFGFGGTNFHVVVQEYTGNYLEQNATHLQEWPAELFVWRAASREKLAESVAQIETALAKGARPQLRDLAYSLWLEASAAKAGGLCLAIVAEKPDDLCDKLSRAREALSGGGDVKLNDPRGVYLTDEPLAAEGQVAFLFPGQGSQYVDMLRDLAVQFPEAQACFERAGRALDGRLPRPLSSYVFPPPSFSEEDDKRNQEALTQTNVAQPALAAADLAMLTLLRELGVEPRHAAGHSYGEFVALHAAGVIDEATLFNLSEARGRFIVEQAGPNAGTMAALDGNRETAEALLAEAGGDAVIANVNSPRQTVVSGTEAAITRVLEQAKAKGVAGKRFAVSCAFHSPLVAPAQQRLAEVLSKVEFRTPQIEVFSNTTALPYPHDPKTIASLLAEHLTQPVNFVDEIEAMYDAGARIFAEVGPKSVLSRLAGDILGERPHLAVAADRPGRSGLAQLQHLLGQLAAHGVAVKLDRLFAGRSVRKLDLRALERETGEMELPPTAWLVNGGRARPARQTKKEKTAPLPVKVVTGEAEAPAAQPSAPQPAPTPAAPASAPVSQPPVAPATGGAAAEQVMAQYQHLMGRFLETQKNVMMAYLQGAPAPAPQTATPAPATPEVPPPAAPEPAPPPATAAGEPEPEPQSVEPSADAALQAAIDKETLTERLVEIVSERTGYPADVLDPDADLEADLGIDSIKRVEILGSLQQSLPETEGLEFDPEQLAQAKTLNAIVDLLYSNGAAPAPEKAAATPARKDAEQRPLEPAFSEQARRFVVKVAEAPPPTQGDLPATGKTVLITDDEGGIAENLAAALREHGCAVVLARHGPSFGESGPDLYTADLTSEEDVARLVEAVRGRGAVGGLAHLLPLRDVQPSESGGLAEWKRGLALDAGSVFLLSRALADDLAATGEGGAFLLAATGMGGAFGSDGSTAATPTQGSVTGFVKTLDHEWPQVRVKAVDLDRSETPHALAGRLLAELCADDGEVEVGYAGERRLVLQQAPAPVNDSAAPALEIDSSSVILVTGGARGITAEAARELAERFQPTLLLVGRTPPPAEEPADTAGLSSPQELKAALIEKARRDGEKVVPALIEEACNRILRDREIRDSLSAMEAAGARVRYHQCDVRDEDAFGALIDEVYRTHGRIDGVIHGAGVIEDKLVKDKTADSFERVISTKADSAFILSRRLRPESLKFLVFFSSVSGRFGNRGQADYAAANEVLNKLAVRLDREWPCRVVAINWGPWLSGMVSQEVQRQFAERDVELIAPEAGRRRLLEEVRYGRKGEVEVLYGSGWPFVEPDGAAPSAESGREHLSQLPLVGSAARPNGGNGRLELPYMLDPARDIYLQDHQLDGKPVLPLAMAMELMAEGALLGRPGLEISAVRDLQMLKGIVVENGPKPLLIVTTDNGSDSDQQTVEATIVSRDDPRLVYYRATVELAKADEPALAEASRLRQRPAGGPADMEGATQFPLSVEKAYEEMLFHGPLFQGIKQIEASGPDGTTATLIPSSPQACLADDPAGPRGWLADPVVIDSALQLQLLWGRVQWDITCLPTRIGAFRRFAPLNGKHIRCEMRVRPGTANPTVRADHYFFGPDGELLGVMEGVELVGSKALNRVAGGHQRETNGDR